ncbi:ATP-binding cassette domain-containing protein [Buchnera aphidicola]|uniref:ATP-binding protein Uup n=1 Tax=Buchnera aphidicola subsp. Schizaphis graminum (strain Sg) TaxID=198804 RepID=UUP_BUCAP|nr:ATP-binding cassette domain-containing protein [Buchnera aphidicola]Q8K9I3.1 RecName: Full=ATP-binding protein Uup [Buchnera aphidicola str. Sg (Schizaphis graminum)]AAM67905.1 ABC transporter ATP-binding protein Uup [Buchnera aphidicola str. Sg (Schizaphis graminum)]AWI49601.1 ABC transporter ATP-binding protein [Buchnera aphidicola (Schizaphis graminum)]
MPLISIQNAFLAFSDLEILKNAVLYINKKERISLIGKNGAGKSTLLKVINKNQELDHGSIIYQKNIKISYLKQDNPKNLDISIYDFIKNQLKKENNKEININTIVEIKKIIKTFQIDKHSLLSELSGGSLRKVVLGSALLSQPDVLLLDEPTNHLDINTIAWLEKFLKKFSGTTLFISHDRSFIQNLCTRIIDLDRGKLTSFPGDYKEFIKLKKENNRIEKTKKKLFDQHLEKEEIWIRKGIKARTTRNEGRVRNLKVLRKEYKNYKKIENFNNVIINEIKNYSGKIIFKLKNISFFIEKKTIIQSFSSIIQYGDKIGLIGNNGSGKSTMIKILMGEKKIQKGSIHFGTKLNIAYFDQDRSTLDSNKSILENVNNGREKIVLNGKEQHLIGYLKKFLFKPNQMKCLVKNLSGGECNRLLLAKLFLKPSNVLILDEPTNDLDLDTLELLENIIIKYSGTVLIVSHDRNFIENTVNKYWIFKGDGLINTHFSSHNNIIKEKNKKIQKKYVLNPIKSNISFLKTKQNQVKKELKKVLNEIEKIENSIKTLKIQMNEPDFFKQHIKNQLPIVKQFNIEEKKLEKILIYWENLEKKL